jgi:hypothetical protein
MNNQPILAATPADPISAYIVEYDAFNAGLTKESAYMEALKRLDDYEPKTERGFVRKFIAMWQGGGNPNREQTKAMLASAARLMGDASQTAWSTMMGSYLAVKARDDAFMAEHYMPHFHQRQADKGHVIPDDIEQAAESLGDHKGDLQDALMGMPAPDAAALMWKLDIAFRVDQDGSMEPLSGWYISQTIADYRRLLGGA